MPVIDAALARGEVSYSKVRAMTRIATAGNEADLLGMARNTTGAQLERICRLKRSLTRLDRAAALAHEECRRYVVQRSTDDGMVSTQVRLHPDEAARFMRALELLGGGNLADGAVALADLALAGTGAAHLERSEGDAAPGDPELGGTAVSPPTGSRPRTVRPPVEVVVHVSAADLEGVTELGDGISAEGCRRLLCDAGVVPMLEDQRGLTIDVGRKTRTLPAALRRALAARDGGCRFPGCTNRRFVDGHHIVHWIDGGATSLENTALLCRRHHRYVHECGFTIERRGEAELVFRDPSGEVIRAQGERPDVKGRLARFVDGWLGDPASIRAPGWDGERVDYELCVDALR